MEERLGRLPRPSSDVAVSTCLGLAAHEGPRRAGCFVVRRCSSTLLPTLVPGCTPLSWSVQGSSGRQPGLLGYEVMVTGLAGQALASLLRGQRPQEGQRGCSREVTGRVAETGPASGYRCGGSGSDIAPWDGLLGGVRAWVWDSLPTVSQASRGPFSPCGNWETLLSLSLGLKDAGPEGLPGAGTGGHLSSTPAASLPSHHGTQKQHSGLSY